MGQYHGIYNKTKKESITDMHSLHMGVKLREFSSSNQLFSALALLLSNSNGRGGGDFNTVVEGNETETKILQELQGRWAGDEIVIQGDYAEEGDPGFIHGHEMGKYHDITFLLQKVWNHF